MKKVELLSVETRCTDRELGVEQELKQVKRESVQAVRMPPEAPSAAEKIEELSRLGRKEYIL